GAAGRSPDPRKTNDRLAVRQAIVSLSRRNRFRCVLDGVTDVAQDLADLIAQEDEGNDRDDRDKREDQRVLRETLAFLVAPLRAAGSRAMPIPAGPHWPPRGPPRPAPLRRPFDPPSSRRGRGAARRPSCRGLCPSSPPQVPVAAPAQPHSPNPSAHRSGPTSP